jgi:hypothetical protein
MNYFNSGPREIFYDYVRIFLLQAVPDSAETLINELAEHADNDAIGKSFLYGVFAGIHAGGGRILLQSLEKRFGTLPGSTRERILRGSIKQLESWAKHAVDAPDLQSVFELSRAEVIQLMSDEIVKWNDQTGR